VSAEIVLACGEKGRRSFTDGAIVERSLPVVVGRTAECLHTAAALYVYSCGNGFGDKRCIKRLARKRGCGKRQRSFRRAPGSGEANIVDGRGAKRGHVDAERVQVLKGLTTQELTADFVARSELAFDQPDVTAFANKRNSSGTACHSTTEDKNFVLQWTPLQIGRSSSKLAYVLSIADAFVVKANAHWAANHRVDAITAIRYFESLPLRKRSMATSLSAFQIIKLGFFNPHWTYGTTK
jgi:hypothetical protein